MEVTDINITLVTGFISGVLLCMLLLPSSANKKKRARIDNPASEASDSLYVTPFDPRRQSAILFGKATDHSEEVVIASNSDFDLNSTIFFNADGSLTRLFLKTKLGLKFFWSEEAIRKYSCPIPSAPKHNERLVEFMKHDCNFKMEHADGSFMDHLQFCYEYSAVHYKEHSPRVLLLHSIMVNIAST